VIRTYKRKLILTKAQEQRILSWIGVCRLVYNMGLEIKIESYKKHNISPSEYDLMKQLPMLRKEYSWIEDVPAQALQETLDRIGRSYKTFFKTYKKGGGFPKFASKKTYKSISFKTIKIKEGEIILPKIGSVKLFKDSEIKGIPRIATLKIEPTGFFICIVCKDVPLKFNSENQAIGLDMGISSFCINSNGEFIKNPKHFKKYERQLRVENRALARKKKGSNRWKDQCKKLALLHHKISNVRKDFLHKESTKIAKQYSNVYIEDLNIKGMVKNQNLSKHILDCGWGMFKTMLEYKTNVIKVNPKHTSQTCFECGTVDSKSRISQSEFCCTNCGHVSNADINAAKNILSKGIALNRQREPLGCA
jgi:putative transposase